MLILSRSAGEAVSLVVSCPDGSQISIAVMVTEIRDRQIKLGFAAPRTVAIAREEIAQPTAALRDLRHPRTHSAGGD